MQALHLTLLSSVLLGASAPALAGGSILTVDDDGAAMFTDIQPAITAAQKGDLILVSPGDYSPFGIAGPDTLKDLVILGSGRVVVPKGQTGCQILVLPKGEQVTIRGLEIERFDPDSQCFYSYGCDGEIWLEEVQFHGENQANDPQTPYAAMSVVTSESVHLIDSYVKGMDGGVLEFLQWFSSVGIESSSSNNSIWDSDVFGGAGSDGLVYNDYVAYAEDGSPAMIQYDQFGDVVEGLYMSGSTIAGGKGGDGFSSTYGCVPGADGAFGLVLSNVDQAYSLDSSLLPGLAGAGAAPCSPGVSPMTGVQLTGSTLTYLAGSAKTLDAVSPVTDGTSLTLTMTGSPGELVTVLVSVAPRADYTFLAQRLGILTIDLPIVATVPVGVVPSGGTLVVNFPFTPVLGVGAEEMTFWLQAVFGTSLQIGAPTAVTVVQ